MAWSNPYSDPSQCTAYVAHVAHERGWDLTSWGDAGDWLTAAAQRHRVDMTPEVGAIAVWRRYESRAGGRGHAAVVTNVSGSEVTVTECNWPEGSGVQTRYVQAADIAGFIHPPAPRDPAKAPPIKRWVKLTITLLVIIFVPAILGPLVDSAGGFGTFIKVMIIPAALVWVLIRQKREKR